MHSSCVLHALECHAYAYTSGKSPVVVVTYTYVSITFKKLLCWSFIACAHVRKQFNNALYNFANYLLLYLWLTKISYFFKVLINNNHEIGLQYY